MNISLKTDERISLVGTTGSGKTELVRFLLSQGVNRCLVIDPKFKFYADGYTVKNRLPFFRKNLKMIYQPSAGDDENLNKILWQLYREENVTIYCDELSMLSDLLPACTRTLATFSRTGRERHVSIWTVIQRPRWVPRIFLTESESFFMFSLRSKEDREYMAGFMGDEVKSPIPLFSFWYTHLGRTDKSTLMRLDLDKQKLFEIENQNREEVI
jgi:hypothetical protein